MIRALQRKFILSAMLAVTILLAALLGAINAGNALAAWRQSNQMLEKILNEETGAQPPPRGDGRKDFLNPPMDENSRLAAVYFTVRADGDGAVLQVDTGRIATVSREDAVKLYETVRERGTEDGKIESFRCKAAYSHRDGCLVYVFLDTSIQLWGILRVLLFSGVAGLACWLAMLLLVVLLSRRAIRPIAENIVRQKQFVTDAGHEIKTPLAIILANTEAMELYQGESKWSKNIREQTVRLSGLMENLLTLARAEESRNNYPFQTVSLSDTLSDTLKMFGESLTLKELHLDQRIENNVEIKGNPEQLCRLVSILVDNAVKYSPDGGQISVCLERRGKAASLTMENTCTALPDCPPEKLFDRFYRGDAARTQQNGGYGIGLSAAKTIVELHGGQIKAVYRPPDTIRFTVTF